MRYCAESGELQQSFATMSFCEMSSTTRPWRRGQNAVTALRLGVDQEHSHDPAASDSAWLVAILQSGVLCRWALQTGEQMAGQTPMESTVLFPGETVALNDLIEINGLWWCGGARDGLGDVLAIDFCQPNSKWWLGGVHEDTVEAVCGSQQNELLYTGSRDSTVKVWSVEHQSVSCQPVHTLSDHCRRPAPWLRT